MKTHKDLDVWKLGIELTELVYTLCEQLPKSETYGLVSQMKRAAVSIPTNIAEGAARNHQKEFIQFTYISLGSISELETLIIISRKVGLLKDSAELDSIIFSLRMKIIGFIKYLKKYT